MGSYGQFLKKKKIKATINEGGVCRYGSVRSRL